MIEAFDSFRLEIFVGSILVNPNFDNDDLLGLINIYTILYMIFP